MAGLTSGHPQSTRHSLLGGAGVCLSEGRFLSRNSGQARGKGVGQAQACQEGFSAPRLLRPTALPSYPMEAQGRPTRPLTDTHPTNPLPPGSQLEVT